MLKYIMLFYVFIPYPLICRTSRFLIFFVFCHHIFKPTQLTCVYVNLVYLFLGSLPFAGISQTVIHVNSIETL